MSAALIVLDKYLPILVGTQSYTLKDDDVYYPIGGAKSFGFFTMPISVARNYRNLLNASDIGRPWRLLSGVTDPLNSDVDYLWGNNGTLSGTNLVSVEDPVSAKDDRWTATAPHDESVMITYITFMDAPDGTGNCVGFLPASLFEQFSPMTPTRY